MNEWCNVDFIFCRCELAHWNREWTYAAGPEWTRKRSLSHITSVFELFNAVNWSFRYQCNWVYHCRQWKSWRIYWWLVSLWIAADRIKDIHHLAGVFYNNCNQDHGQEPESWFDFAWLGRRFTLNWNEPRPMSGVEFPNDPGLPGACPRFFPGWVVWVELMMWASNFLFLVLVWLRLCRMRRL